MSAIADPAFGGTIQQVYWREQGDCTLADGTAIRVKVSNVGEYALGLSLWINRKKVLSLHAYYGAAPRMRLTIAGRDIEICDDDPQKLRREPNPPGKSRLESLERVLTCRHIPVPAAGTADDILEYPPPGVAPRGIARSLVLSSSENDRVCKAVKRVENKWRHEQYLVPPDGAEKIEWHKALSPTNPKGFPLGDYVEKQSWSEFDFDSDGATDRVWLREDYSHMSEGTYFAMLPAADHAPPKWFAKAAGSDTRFYSGKDSPYHSHFVHWAPFRYEERTYLIGAVVYPIDLPGMPEVMVVTPDGDKLRHVCSFDRIPENY
jgi:hypothetical protein